MKSQHRLVTRCLVAALGATALTLGPLAAPALADPVVIQVEVPGQQAESKPEARKPEKAEKMGGGLVNKMIDLGAGVIKCGFSLATETVPCKL
ncbi:hypothetical protein ACFVMC_10180 [Nocardia sp. NPDC127579]|uniref:hypothetical protein n=1 Tax=Nocardia sp. NPDC127579 TaxID=3345402 RepID=UPI00362F098D